MSDNNHALSVTLKAGTGFDSPWVVVYADSVADARARVEAVEQSGLLAAASNAAKTLQATYAASGGLGPVQQLSSAYTDSAASDGELDGHTVDQWATPAPDAPAQERCKHGVLVERRGESSRGPWTGLFCPSPKGTPDQCKPRFL